MTFKKNKYLLTMSALGLFGLEGIAFAAYCSNTADPLVISADCYALTLLDNKSAVTVSNGVTVTERVSGFFSPIEVRSSVTTLTNNGTIKASLLTVGAVEVSSLKIFGSGSVGTLTNNGTINAAATDKAGLDVNGAINVLNNNGTISAVWNAYALNVNGATINTFNNSGTLAGPREAIILSGGGSNIGTFNNSGTVVGGNFSTNNYYSDAILLRGGASIGTLINTGTIDHSPTFTSPLDGHKEYVSAINNQGTIGVLTNTGNLATNGGFGISNSGTISTLNNRQGDLALRGNLPVNYNTIINSPSQYGKLSVTNPNGTTNFGIYQGSVIPSGSTTYTAVLSGVTSSNIASTSGTYGGGLVTTSWSLKNSSGNTWDLVTNPSVVSAKPTVASSGAGTSLANQILVSYTAAAATTVNSAGSSTSGGSSSSTGSGSTTGSSASSSTGSGSTQSGTGTSAPNPILKNGNTLVSAVQALTGSEVNQLATVHAEGYSSNMTIGLEQMKTVANTVMDRIHKPIADSNSNSVSYELDAGRYIWADIAGFTGTVNSYNGLSGFGYNTYYGVVGLDLFRNETGGLGIYAGAGNSNMTQSAQVSQRFNNNTGYLGIYGGTYLATDVKLSGALGYSFGTSTASRDNPDIGNFAGGAASGSYSANGAFAAFKLSHSMLVGEKLTLTPFIGGSYSQLNTGAIEETGGGDFNYSIKAATSYQAITFAGAEFVQPLQEVGDQRLSAVGFYRFSYNWSANTASAHTVTASSSVFGTFTQTGANMGPVSNLFGLGLQGQLSKNTSVRIGAVAAINTNGTQYGGGGELKIRF